MAIRTFNSVGGFSVGENPTTVVLANGDITTGNGTFSGNVQANTAVKTDSLLHLDGTPWDFQQPAGSVDGQIQYYYTGDFGASANLSFNPSTNVLEVIGNISTNNISATGFINTSSNINAAWFNGNVVGNVSGNIAVPGGTGSNTQIVFSDDGNINTASGFTFNKSTNFVSISGNISAQNANLGNLVTANFFSGTLTTAAQPNITSLGTVTGITASSTATIQGANLVSANFITGTLTTALQPNITQVGTLGNLSVQGNIQSGNANLGNLATANFFTGTLTTGSQPNITSIGNLTSLVVTGNANVNNSVNAGNLGVANYVITSLIPSNDNTYILGNTGALWSALYVTNVNIGSTYIRSTGNVINMDAANVANNASVGSLTVRNDATIQGNATVSGNLTVSGDTTYINITTLSIKDPLIQLGGSNSGGNATAYDGKDRGMIMHNYFSNGSGPLNQAFVWKTGNSQFEAYSSVTDYTNEVVSGTLGNIRASAFLGNLNGTVLQASQPNITTVGTLGNLVVSGNLRVNTTANVNSLIASGLQYPTSDGSGQQVLSTYGNGMLYWATVSTSSLSNGNSNITVYANSDVTISSNGVANVFRVTSSNASVAGNLSVTGTSNLANTIVTNLIIGNSTIRANTVTTTSVSAAQTIAIVSTTGIRGVIFDVKGEQSAGGKYSIATVYCVHNGTDVDYAVSGSVLLGGATGSLSVNLISGNLYLGVTPTSSNSTVWTTQYRTI